MKRAEENCRWAQLASIFGSMFITDSNTSSVQILWSSVKPLRWCEGSHSILYFSCLYCQCWILVLCHIVMPEPLGFHIEEKTFIIYYCLLPISSPPRQWYSNNNKKPCLTELTYFTVVIIISKVLYFTENYIVS